jgi:RecB family exonuclease
VTAFDLRTLESAAERETLEAVAAEALACDERGVCAPAALAARIEQLHAAPRTAPFAPAPLHARERQPQRPVRRRTQHFSASSLEMYVDCARKWYYRYTCATVDDPGSPASFYGTAFHWALEQFHGEVVQVDPAADRAGLATKLTAWVNAAFELYRSGFGSNLEYELHRRRACRTAQRYVDWLLARARIEPFDIAGTEVEVALELEGLKFVGFIDRLDRERRSGTLTVLDYKTGKIAEYASSYRQEIAAFVEFQLPFYYWSQTAAGERVSKLALIPLRDGYGEIQPVELEVVPLKAPLKKRDRSARGVIGIDELERARAKMIEIARSIASGKIERFPTAASVESCEYCVYRRACRERPAAEAPRFSR